MIDSDYVVWLLLKFTATDSILFSAYFFKSGLPLMPIKKLQTNRLNIFLYFTFTFEKLPGKSVAL